MSTAQKIPQYRLFAGPHLAFIGTKERCAKRLGVKISDLHEGATFPRPATLVPVITPEGKRMRQLWKTETQYLVRIVHGT